MTDYVVVDVDDRGAEPPAVLEDQWLILLPDGNWYSNDHESQYGISSFSGDAMGVPARYYRTLAEAIDAVGWLMKRAGALGATEYRPTIYRRVRHTAWTMPVPDEQSEHLLSGVVVVQADGKVVRNGN